MVYNREHRNSAFESYKKPTSPSDSKQPSAEGEEKEDSAHVRLVRTWLVTLSHVSWSLRLIVFIYDISIVSY